MKEINFSISGNTMVVQLSKELDHHNAIGVKEEIDKHIYNGEVKNIIFDFKNTTFMDSSGIGVILGRHRVLKNIGGIVGVANISKSIDRIFCISGLYKIVEKCGEL